MQRFRSYSTRPRGTPILIGAGLAKPDRRGNIQVDGWRLRRSGHAEFSLPRGSSAASHFNSTDFHVTHRFFVTFFTEESNVPLRPPLSSFPVPFWEPPRALAKQLKHFCAFMQCFIARKLHFIHTFGIIYGEKLWITWTTKWG